MRTFNFPLAASFLALVACSSSPSAPASAVSPAAEDATDGGRAQGPSAPAQEVSPAELIAIAECDAEVRCDVYGLTAGFGHRDQCVSRRTLANAIAFAVPGHAKVDVAGAARCAAAIESKACVNGWNVDKAVIDACRWKGPRPIGARCFRNGQCQTGLCSVGDATGVCGTCVAAPSRKVGESCQETTAASDKCEDDIGTMCIRSCVRLLGEGETCDRNREPICQLGLDCMAGKCTKHATSVGVACDPFGETKPQCSRGRGLVCDNGTCQEMVFVEPGAVCNANARDECRGGRCEKGPVSGQKICYGNDIPDGAKCSMMGLVNTAQCIWPASCVDGKCTLPSPEATECE